MWSQDSEHYARNPSSAAKVKGARTFVGEQVKEAQRMLDMAIYGSWAEEAELLGFLQYAENCLKTAELPVRWRGRHM
jgi:hypothetical protein